MHGVFCAITPAARKAKQEKMVMLFMFAALKWSRDVSFVRRKKNKSEEGKRK
jgi:hypothetical protein